MLYEEIVVTVEGDVQVMAINRPDEGNALSRRTHAEMTDAVRACSSRCMIITGSADSFCVGDDLNEVVDELIDANGNGSPAERPLAEPCLAPLAGALLSTDIPVIAAVNGPAFGWGMELALMADIRIASNKASLGGLNVLRGLSCDVAGLTRLAEAVGRERASELLFTGDEVGADRARELGLVSKVVAHDDLPETAMALAQRIAASPPLAVQTIKRGLRKALDPDWEELGVWVSSNLARLTATEDHREGVTSMVEQREPEFTGR